MRVGDRILPALPDRDRTLGEIRWGRWEPQLVVTHVDSSCSTCAFTGPLSQAFGKTWYQPPARRWITQRSRIAEGQRVKSVPVVSEPYWCTSHYAVRCPQCDETCVCLLDSFSPDSEFTELEHFYRPPTTERAVPPTQDNVLF